ncbi:hypothetical protein LJC48_06825 [Desulfovibrio sp. OttesenSCG-928-C06]|nr:hypothetical protein [Desulfovibrio sp. OttesenSCG-928-C06]
MSSMSKVYPLNKGNVEKHALENRGSYRLGNALNEKGGLDGVSYVGRDDVNVRTRLMDHVNSGKASYFRVFNADSVREAYEQECKDYHEFKPAENTNHPAKPKNHQYPCPVSGCEYCE